MKTHIKYFIFLLIFCFAIGIFFAINAPRPSLSTFDEANILRAIPQWNYDMPRKIGTIGTMDSITYHNKTIIYNITVSGSNSIKEVYKKNYNKFKDILKYTLISMNGQRNSGTMLASILKAKGLNLCFRVYTQDRDMIEWNMPGSELKKFMDECKISPTTALQTVIDMHIEIGNINLPVKLEDFHDPIRSVIINTIFGDLDESCLPQAISHIGNDIIFLFDIDENVIDIEELELVNDNNEALEALASSMTEDPDILEFASLIVISHSNMVLAYEGRRTHRKGSIRIPYSILKEYCKVPQYLLS